MQEVEDLLSSTVVLICALLGLATAGPGTSGQALAACATLALRVWRRAVRWSEGVAAAALLAATGVFAWWWRTRHHG